MRSCRGDGGGGREPAPAARRAHHAAVWRWLGKALAFTPPVIHAAERKDAVSADVLLRLTAWLRFQKSEWTLWDKEY